ncbi:MAG: ABC transporter substrate-binding protein [Bacteroidetes bacterium]|nr:MAG: ABC transporter substrate-binding protein [Bacteroidota bacterium]
MNRLYRFFLDSLIFLSLLLAISGCDRTSPSKEIPVPLTDETGLVLPDSLQHVKLLPYWVTTAQFAGYYIGQEKGIFRKYGIDLEVIPFLPTMSTDVMIRNEEADFFLLWLVNAIQLRASGLPIVNIAQLSSRSSLLLLTKKSSGIETIADMDGKQAAIWSGYELQPQVLFQKYHVDVRIIPIGSSNNLFLTDGVEIINANWFDEYHTILNSGYNEEELEPFFFSDYGLNFLEDGIYCLRSTIDRDPGLCRRFVEASLESWKYAFDHPEEVIPLVLEKQREQNMPANVPHQQWMLDRYRDLYYPDPETGIPTSLPDSSYQSIATILLEARLIDNIPPFRDFYISYQSLGQQPEIKGTISR